MSVWRLLENHIARGKGQNWGIKEPCEDAERESVPRSYSDPIISLLENSLPWLPVSCNTKNKRLPVPYKGLHDLALSTSPPQLIVLPLAHIPGGTANTSPPGTLHWTVRFMRSGTHLFLRIPVPALHTVGAP